MLKLGKKDLELKFGSPEKLSARLMHLQESGRQLATVVHFSAPNDGWVPGLNGQDPNDSGGDITDTRSIEDNPDYDDLTRTLAQVQALHVAAIKTITDYEARQKAKPNSQWNTSPARRITDNDDSRRSGPRTGLFP